MDKPSISRNGWFQVWGVTYIYIMTHYRYGLICHIKRPLSKMTIFSVKNGPNWFLFSALASKFGGVQLYYNLNFIMSHPICHNWKKRSYTKWSKENWTLKGFFNYDKTVSNSEANAESRIKLCQILMVILKMGINLDHFLLRNYHFR